ncbi:MAG TPA: hypothetical protein VIK04_06455, partial [Solirubrobacteraceae bacterium]
MLALACDDATALLPGAQDAEHADGDEDRDPAAVDDLGQVGAQEPEVDDQEADCGGDDLPQRPPSAAAH